ncbi:hypothetical protein [Nostoc sp. GT001]|uniref:hypothetical protein n=1 Tax=Nostoc sp. GT001 TaxID=3056647 RepID=UPI0025AA7B8C|nr:hypothetical protein [Nostoc sp. GT001]MDM9583156.1 hypothetical protein [Nostoc sp. GT001]
MTFRTTEEILSAIKKLAKNSDKSVSQIINDLLAAALGIDDESKDGSDELDRIRQEMRQEIQQVRTELEQLFFQKQQEALKK